MSIVLELQKEALDPAVRATDLLRKAYVVARKLNIKELKDWIDLELKGYESTDCPEYRKVVGLVKAWNPFRGWIPAIFEDHKVAEMLSKRYIGQPLSQIEELSSNSEDSFRVPFPPEIQLRFMRAGNHQFESSLHVDKAQIVSILSSVKHIVLEWSLKLEESGILGDNMTFSRDDVKNAQLASEVTIHNFQGVFGNTSNSSISQVNTLNVQKNDFDSLRRYLEAIGVEKEDIGDLKGKISADRVPKRRGDFGPKINEWIGRMIGKANSGLWDIGVGAAGGLLVEVISKYYGL